MSSVSTGRAAPGDQRALGYHSRGARIAGLLFTAVWLIYLVQPVVSLFTGHHGALYIAGGLTIVLAFCTVYLILVPAWPLAPRHALPGLAVLAALAVAGCVLYGGTGASSLWIFVSSACGLLVQSRRWAVRAVLACAIGYVIFSLTGHVDRSDLLINLLPTVFVGLAMIGLRHQLELTNELQQARGEVAKLAANEERLRLARDLHDLTGQSLSMITLKSELAARLLRRLPAGDDRDRAIAETQEVAAVSRQTLHDIREAVSGYRRPTLAVEMITARMALESAGITPHDDADLVVVSGSFDPDAEAALAWCLREAATNVIRHSGAGNAYISLARRDRDLSLEIRDDGASPEATEATGATAGATEASGMGLRGMSERLSAVGGHLEVRPSPHGFSRVATVPADIGSRDRAGHVGRLAHGADRADRADPGDKGRGVNVSS
jgi:two-component system sensor histidine kinase DesK